MILSVTDLRLEFGGVVALKDVGFDVAEHESFAVLGPNGAGKTSLFNCLSGLVRPQAGSVRVDGTEVLGRPPYAVARLGVGRTFQNLGLFGSMTVLENVLVGSHQQVTGGALAAAVRWPSAFRSERRTRARAEALIELVELSAYRDSPVSALPYGIRKRVEIAKAVAAEPRLLLLDEPVAGMNDEETGAFVDYVMRLKSELGLTLVLIEHDVATVMKVADRILALDFGEVIGIGSPEEIRRDPRVVAAYLGEEVVEDLGARALTDADEKELARE